MSKTIIINQATLDPTYDAINKAAHDTWGTYNHEDVKILHYYGKYNKHLQQTDKFPTLPADGECLLVDNDLILGTYDTNYPTDHPVRVGHDNSPITYSYGGVDRKIDDARGEKFIMTLEYCLNNLEFDFIQRISCTSYVDVAKMMTYLNTLSKTKVYNGARNMYNSEYYFITGHNVLMSRDTVETLVKHKKEYLAIPYPEDLATGRLIIHDLSYTNFSEQTNSDTFTVVEHDNLTLSTNPSTYLYRTRYFHPEVFYDLHKLINR
jgi:hypothetical protein